MVKATMMKAIRIHEYGGPDRLIVDRVERPVPRAGEVLVRVMSASLNAVDWKLRSGALKDWMPLTLPWIPGIDLSGFVEERGPGVATLSPGQAVFGVGTGAYAQYAIVKANDVIPKPEGLTFDQAAAVPVAALTAWQSLMEDASIEPGTIVAIHGAAGGVGHFAVQLALLKGATVIATASKESRDFVLSLGAREVIDYRATPFETAMHDVDVVYDTVGGDITDRSLQVLKRGGLLISIAGQPTQEKAKERGVTAKRSGRASAEKLSKIAQLIVEKKIAPHIARVFPLEEAGRAHESCQSGHNRGKTVLHVGDA